jgi:hypothetical protein
MRRIKKMISHIPNLARGYNIYVNRDKFSLIDYTFKNLLTKPAAFADLGGVWKVNAAYTRYALDNYFPEKAYLIDTNFSPRILTKLNRYKNLEIIQADFADDKVVDQIRKVDALFLFDVLLHQVNPDWDQILQKYARITDCMIIYNQQIVGYDTSIRLTSLPLAEYKELVPKRRDDFYETIYRKDQEIHPQYQKPWKDIHNIWQWGITDKDLQDKMDMLGYQLAFYHNYGRFTCLKDFEDHAFVFLRKPAN